MTDIDDRVCIQEYPNGALVSTTYGKTEAERQLDHDNGKCDAFCAICYAEACEYYAKYTKPAGE